MGSLYEGAMEFNEIFCRPLSTVMLTLHGMKTRGGKAADQIQPQQSKEWYFMCRAPAEGLQWQNRNGGREESLWSCVCSLLLTAFSMWPFLTQCYKNYHWGLAILFLGCPYPFSTLPQLPFMPSDTVVCKRCFSNRKNSYQRAPVGYKQQATNSRVWIRVGYKKQKK